MAKKKYDLSVKVGTYEKGGETKGKYMNVGAVIEKDDGGTFILLDRTFNPAGCPNPDGKETVLISMFEPKERDGSKPAQPTQKAKQEAQSDAGAHIDDSIPFMRWEGSL